MYAIQRMDMVVQIVAPIIVMEMEHHLVIQMWFAHVQINGQEIDVHYVLIIIGLILINNARYALLDIMEPHVRYPVVLFVFMELRPMERKPISIQFVLVIMDGPKIYTVNVRYAHRDILD